MKFLEYYAGSIILWSVIYLIGKILFDEHRKINLYKLILVILTFSCALTYLNIIDSEILRGTIKIMSVYSLQYLFYKIIFKESESKCMTAALIMYLCLFVSEIIVVLITTAILNAFNLTMASMKNDLLMNIIISLCNLAITEIAKNKLILFVKNSNYNTKSSLIIIVIILVTIALLVFKIPVDKWKISTEFIITMMILLCFCFVGLFLLKQKSDIQKTTSMYQQLASYSNVTTKLLEDYRIVSHEHKNQLSIIRGMVDDSNSELIAYIDNLLNKRNIIKYQWANQLNNLPITGLKGLLNYKLIEMESKKININISISKDIAKSKLNKLTAKQKDELYSIMGIYLDNAIEAAKMSKKKEVSLEIYKDKRDVVIILANTYSGKINLAKIDDYGYTTKGKNHGIGLHIVKRILEENNIFSQNRTLFEEYYIQELRVKLSNLTKQTK